MLFSIDIGLFSAAGALKSFDRYSSAHTLFLVAIALFPIALGMLLGYYAERLSRPRDKLLNKADGVLPPQPQFVSAPYPWTEYTQDVFDDVIWRWHYKPDIDYSPRDLTPCCPECIEPTPLRVSLVTATTTPKKKSSWLMMCSTHKRVFVIPAEWGPNQQRFLNIVKLINQKLEDGSWVEVVNRQRAVKGMLPITLPQATIATAVPRITTLDVIAERILSALCV